MRQAASGERSHSVATAPQMRLLPRILRACYWQPYAGSWSLSLAAADLSGPILRRWHGSVFKGSVWIRTRRCSPGADDHCLLS